MNLEYRLKYQFKIAKGGEEVDAEVLTITAPSNKVIKHVSAIDNEMHKSFVKMSNMAIDANSDSQKDADEVSGEECLMALSAGGADLNKCFDALKNILDLTCFVNENVKFTPTMFQKMDYRDTKLLLGEYIKFFLVTSLGN